MRIAAGNKQGNPAEFQQGNEQGLRGNHNKQVITVGDCAGICGGKACRGI